MATLNLNGRLNRLGVELLKRQRSRQIIEDLAAGPLEDLTDEELDTLIAEMDRLDPEGGQSIRAMSDEELRKIVEDY
jgi:uncharacterized membrane protein YheB (UPF0754 family)